MFSSKSYSNGLVCPAVRLADDCQLSSSEFITSTNESLGDGSVGGSNLNSVEPSVSVIEDFSGSNCGCIEMKTPENGMDSENM